MLLALPERDVLYPTFQFSYRISGTKYNWFQKIVYGPNGNIYKIVGLAIGATIVALIIMGGIIGIVKCCNKSKVQVEPIS